MIGAVRFEKRPHVVRNEFCRTDRASASPRVQSPLLPAPVRALTDQAHLPPPRAAGQAAGSARARAAAASVLLLGANDTPQAYGGSHRKHALVRRCTIVIPSASGKASL